MNTSQIVGVIIVFVMLIALGLSVILRRDKEQRLQKSGPRLSEAGRIMAAEYQAMIEEFVREQLDRERELRRHEVDGQPIVSSTPRPFKGKPLPPMNASMSEIIQITGIRSYNEIDPDLFGINPYKSILR